MMIKSLFFTFFCFAICFSSVNADIGALFSDIEEDEYLRSPFFKQSFEPHDITFLHTGLSSLQKRLDLINNAQDSIEFEYFIYEADAVGRILAQALVERAKAGVNVRIMLDSFISAGHIDAFHAHELEKYGVEIRFYNNYPLARAYKFQFRNHRKLLVVDDRYAMTGGRNIKDEYYDLSSDYNFIDRDILVEGPIVEVMRKSFEAYWDSEFVGTLERPERPSRDDLFYQRSNRSRRHLNSSDYERDVKRWESKVESARDFFRENENDRALLDFIYIKSRPQMELLNTSGCNEVTFVSDVPGIGSWAKDQPYRKASQIVFEAMNRTQDRFVMESPYFILNEQSHNVIDEALERGVEFKFLTNSLYSTDAIYVSAAFFGNLRPWVDRGLKAHIFKGDVLEEQKVNSYGSQSRWGVHSKSMIFDDDLFMVGTFNFDPRSKDWNSEMAFFCRDSKLTEDLHQSMQKRFDGSILLDSHEIVKDYEFYQTGLLKRTAYYLLYLPSNILDFLL